VSCAKIAQRRSQTATLQSGGRAHIASSGRAHQRCRLSLGRRSSGGARAARRGGRRRRNRCRLGRRRCTCPASLRRTQRAAWRDQV
jgi:hypothetical protein